MKFSVRATRSGPKGYTAKDIEVLEGLEPVRRRPGMYIGGTDVNALHHLAAEILDNAMDEAVAGHASRIEMELKAGNVLTIRDNGRGIPVDPHPKFKNKSALEVIMTTLHAGGKFDGKVYETSGGLHGVGASVVNALSEWMEVEVARDKHGHKMRFERGHADRQAEGPGRGQPARHHRHLQARRQDFRRRAFLAGAALPHGQVQGLSVPRRGNPLDLRSRADQGRDAGGRHAEIPRRPARLPARAKSARPSTVTHARIFRPHRKTRTARARWNGRWPGRRRVDPFIRSYCNTIPTPQGGTHEQGLRNALTKALRAHGERANNRKTALITADDVMDAACAVLSVFIREPEFQGQTKDKLSSARRAAPGRKCGARSFRPLAGGKPGRSRQAARFRHRPGRGPSQEDGRKRKSRRKAATRKLRLPGKLADCTRDAAEGTEIFLVEGDCAGGSAKQARDRATQAILPLRGKILNVASAGGRQAAAEPGIVRPGAGAGLRHRREIRRRAHLRYERVIIMTDADVDGAHIASLLLTFFYREMPELIADGHLFLAMPPLYRLTQGGKTVYARDDADRERLLKSEFRPTPRWMSRASRAWAK